MNGALAMLQQALDWGASQAKTAVHIIGAVFTNQPEPARTVVVYTAVIITLAVVFVPKILKSAKK